MVASTDFDIVHVAVLPGDGIGPEVMAEALPLLEWAKNRGRRLSWEVLPYGAEHYLSTGETLSESGFHHIQSHCDAVLFGAVGDPRIPDGRHAERILLRLRQGLQLAVNWRPCAPTHARQLPWRGMDPNTIRLEIFRENTEGPYGLKGRSEPGLGVDEAWHTEPAITRLLEAAFARAEATQRPLTLAHKANVLKHGHGLWMAIFQRLRDHYRGVKAQAMHADALLCALVQNPTTFGIIAADNYLGDLISDLTAAFLGGMGVAPSLSYAPHRPFRCSALAEPVHGSAPDRVGQGTANPMGMILSTALLFRHFGWSEEAGEVEAAVADALRAGDTTTDLGGTCSTADAGAAVRRRLGI
jgi:3-isopropylmalate dehydrogenase